MHSFALRQFFDPLLAFKLPTAPAFVLVEEGKLLYNDASFNPF